MEITIEVVGQAMKVACPLRRIISGTQNYVKFCFHFSTAWDGFSIPLVARFVRGENVIDVALDDKKTCYLPSAVTPGKWEMTLYGIDQPIIALTEKLALCVVPSGLKA